MSSLASSRPNVTISDDMIPAGFRFASAPIGIKASGKPDLTLVVADGRVAAAGVYTTNLIHAASIDWNRAAPIEQGMRGLVINSGNANACTGVRGEQDNARMAALAGASVGDDPQSFFVMSTGVIGHFLPMGKLESGIPSVAKSLSAGAVAFEAAARGIMTTDQFMKVAFRSLETASGTVRIAAMAKGAGMIGPKMATMLAVVTTDAALGSAELHRALKVAADASFNCISVEGHMSTSDALVCFASGKVTLTDSEKAAFQEALTEACIELAKLIQRNAGVGASQHHDALAHSFGPGVSVAGHDSGCGLEFSQNGVDGIGAGAGYQPQEQVAPRH